MTQPANAGDGANSGGTPPANSGGTPPANSGGSTGGDGAGDGGYPADLGDAGKRALDAERQAAKDAQRSAKAASDQLAAVQKELDDLKAANQSDQEKALDAARKEGDAAARAEVTAELHTERKRTAILTAAGGKLADPDDAVLHLIGDIELNAEGRPDPKKVDKAIDDLLERKPHLRKPGTAGSAEGGARGGNGTPANVTPGRGRLAAAYGASSSNTSN